MTSAPSAIVRRRVREPRLALIAGVGAAAVVVLAATGMTAQSTQSIDPATRPSPLVRAPMIQPPADEIEVMPLRGNLYALFGAGSNIVVSVGGDGALLVDAGSKAMTGKVLAAVQRLQRDVQARTAPGPLGFGAETRSSVDRHVPGPVKPIRYIINTHYHPDHSGGNEALRRAGRTYTGGNVAGDIRDSGEGAAIVAHENVLTRLSAHAEGQAAPSADALPTDSYFVQSYKLSQYFNGEGVVLMHMPRAHTDGDSVVHFRGADVIAMGDLMSTGSYPVVDVDHGGTINGIVDGLNRVLDLAITEFRLEGGTIIVPGHGRIVDAADVYYYRDMVTIIRDRVLDAVKKGMTLEQVKAAKLTIDYDTEYGAGSGESSTERFVEAVYKSLGGGQPVSSPAKGRRR